MAVNKKRHIFQALATLFTNGYVTGFMAGKIYDGKLKTFCVPGLNCYSCPGALGSCPIGAMQAVIGGRKHSFSYYTAGIIMLFGVILGRFVCGVLCPFGFIQDLLYKIPSKKFKVPYNIHKILVKFKYIIALLMVIILPAVLTNKFGIAPPYFCKWICPVGTLEGGLPLISTNETLRNGLGFLFGWKVFILVTVIVLSIVIYRPFCKYLCPLGAFYSVFNRYSFYTMSIDEDKCTKCGICEKVCGMQVKVMENINSLECIRCGDCKASCPHKAIKSGFQFKIK